MDTVNGLNAAQISELLKPFDPSIIETRKSDEQQVVPHDYVRGRLSEIFGPLGWSEQTLELTEVPTGDDGRADSRFIAYRARVRVTIHPHGKPVAYWDGAGAWGQGRSVRDKTQNQTHTAIWDLHSDCMNGALSVAFLRATKNLGNQFGLCLYSSDPERPGYQIGGFLTHPPLDECPPDEGQQPLAMDYTADPEMEHAAS